MFLDESHRVLNDVALNNLNQGSFKASALCWRKILQREPEDEAAIQNLAFCLIRLECYDQALEYANKGLLLDANNLEFSKITAEANYHLGQYPEAAEAAQKVVERDSEDAWQWQLLIYSKLFTGDIEEGEIAIRQALEQHPKHTAFRYLNAKLLLQQDEVEIALEQLEQLLEDDHNCVDAHRLIAEIYLLQKQVEKAQKHIELIIKLDDGNIHDFHNLGWIYLKAVRIDEAKICFKTSLEDVEEQVEGYLGLGHCYLEAKEFDEAENFCRQGLIYDDQEIRLWQLLTLIAHKNDDKELVSDCLNRIKEMEKKAI